MGLIPEGFDHVLTCKPEIMRELGADEGFQYLFTQGFKHRPDLLEVKMSPRVREEILTHLREGLHTFCTKNTLHTGQCLPWVALVLEEASRLLFNDRRFADGKVLSTRNRPHEAGTRFQPWVHCYDSFLRVLHARFIVTTADKLGNNYVVCCKKLYLTTVEVDLTSGVFYSRVPEDVDVRSI
jgi:hypothetical protein